MQTATPTAKRPKPGDALFKKALCDIQSACPEALSSTDSAKYAKDHSFVIVGEGLDKNLDEVKAAINKIILAEMSIELIRKRATQSPSRLMSASTRCKTTKTLLSRHGLMIRLTNLWCEEPRQTQPFSALPPRLDVVIQCYQCQGFGHKTNACIQEARFIWCGVHHKLADCTVSRDTTKCADYHGDHVAS